MHAPHDVNGTACIINHYMKQHPKQHTALMGQPRAECDEDEDKDEAAVIGECQIYSD